MRRMLGSSSTTSTQCARLSGTSSPVWTTRFQSCTTDAFRNITLSAGASGKAVKVAVAMSGGVDSSTAAYILKSAGHEVVGLSMQMYDKLTNDGTTYGGCCTIDDLDDARRLAW